MLVTIKFEKYSNVIYFPKRRNSEYKKIVVVKFHLLVCGDKACYGLENILFRKMCWSKELKEPENL